MRVNTLSSAFAMRTPADLRVAEERRDPLERVRFELSVGVHHADHDIRRRSAHEAGIAASDHVGDQLERVVEHRALPASRDVGAAINHGHPSPRRERVGDRARGVP
jgi:hypothetical protein